MTSLSTLQHVRRAMKRNVRVITTMVMMMMMMMMMMNNNNNSALSTINYKTVDNNALPGCRVRS